MRFVLLLFFMLSFLKCSSQNEYITLGKRKNIIWDRKIDSTNLATMYTYYYPIFFKINDSKFTKIGLYGKHLFPHLNYSVKEVNTEFYKFRRNKILSHILLTSSISFLSFWIYRGAKYYIKTGDNNPFNAYFKNKQSLFIIGYTVSISSSIFLNIRGDKKLINAIKIHNNNIQKEYNKF